MQQHVPQINIFSSIFRVERVGRHKENEGPNEEAERQNDNKTGTKNYTPQIITVFPYKDVQKKASTSITNTQALQNPFIYIIFLLSSKAEHIIFPSMPHKSLPASACSRVKEAYEASKRLQNVKEGA